MYRRTFLKKASMGTMAASTLPILSLPQEEIEYSVLELMGKESIELFGDKINLRKEAHDAFIEMKKAAYQDGYDIKIVSSYRDFYRQQAIWDRKYINYTEVDGMSPIVAMEKIIEYSTIPGTSRHHWGTEIDVIDGYPKTNGDVLVPGKFEEGGPFEGLKLWMDQNSERFGFYLVYTDSVSRRGFKYEPWHYSYAPLSKSMLAQFRRKNLVRLISEEEFEGASELTTNFLRNYIHDNILDINPELL